MRGHSDRHESFFLELRGHKEEDDDEKGRMCFNKISMVSY
jgi:hypothetical protein